MSPLIEYIALYTVINYKQIIKKYAIFKDKQMLLKWKRY